MSTMMSSKPQRDNTRKRPNTGSRNARSGGRNSVDRTIQIDGVFTNTGFTHVIVSLLGYNVQVQVKNGRIYEGILKTVSPKMEVVLEIAHIVEDCGDKNSNCLSTMASRDTIINKIIFKVTDVVSIKAVDVDLDYAVKGVNSDSFTDNAISKFNGQAVDKDCKELQPWDGDYKGGDEIAIDGESSSNGWDPVEMFRRNEEQFNVKSNYDDKLTQYTTPLERKNTKEYRKREEEAARLAQEIERSDNYKKSVELENGSGDEEMQFSAVVRPDCNPASSSTAKYIPPGRRQGPGRGGRGGGGMQNQMNRSVGSMNISHPQQQQPQQPQPVLQHHQTKAQSPPQTSSVQMPVQSSPQNISNNEIKINGEEKRVVVDPVVVHKPSPVVTPEQATSSLSPDGRVSNVAHTSPSNLSNKLDRTNSSPKAREDNIRELKEFSAKFKLTEDSRDNKKIDRSPTHPSPVQHQPSQPDSPLQQVEKPQEASPEKCIEQRVEEIDLKDSPVEPDKPDALTEAVKKSSLNPNAKEFNPNVKTFFPRSTTQTPTPPRPQTQSPQPIQGPLPGQVYPYYLPSMLPVPAQQVPSTRPQRYPKVIVQQRQDLTAAAAQAATGHPLLAQAATIPAPYPIQYTVMQQQQPSYQMQVGSNQPRMINPQSMQMVPTSHPGSFENQIPQHSHAHTHSGQVIMTQGPQPMPAHLSALSGPQQVGHPTPAHVNQVPVNQNQGPQVNQPQPGHPAPSPVQHGQSNSQNHHQVHPQTSGTPQPHLSYPQVGIQGHPPLQPSPQNPTSPQQVHPVSVAAYPYTSQTHLHAGPQLTMTQTHPQTHIIHTNQGHSPHPGMQQPQVVFMPQPHPPNAHMQHGPQFQGQPVHGPSVPGQGPHVMHQSSMQTAGLPVSAPSGVHQVAHFVPQVPSQAAPVQAYQQQGQ